MTENEKRQRGNREIPIKEVNEFSVSADGLRQTIAEKAYELYECRGCCHGRDIEDWLEAERLVLAEIASQETQGKNRASSPQRPKKD